MSDFGDFSVNGGGGRWLPGCVGGWEAEIKMSRRLFFCWIIRNLINKFGKSVRLLFTWERFSLSTWLWCLSEGGELCGDYGTLMIQESLGSLLRGLGRRLTAWGARQSLRFHAWLRFHFLSSQLEWNAIHIHSPRLCWSFISAFERN